MITKCDVKFNHPKVELYVNDEYQFDIDTDVELNNVRLWVVRDKVRNVYFLFKDKKITVNPDNGDLSEWPYGFFDQELIQFNMLFKLRKNEPFKVNYMGIEYTTPFFITN